MGHYPHLDQEEWKSLNEELLSSNGADRSKSLTALLIIFPQLMKETNDIEFQQTFKNLANAILLGSQGHVRRAREIAPKPERITLASNRARTLAEDMSPSDKPIFLETIAHIRESSRS